MSNIGHSESKSKLIKPRSAPKKPSATGGYYILTPSSMAMKPRKASEFKNELRNTWPNIMTNNMPVFASFTAYCYDSKKDAACALACTGMGIRIGAVLSVNSRPSSQ